MTANNGIEWENATTISLKGELLYISVEKETWICMVWWYWYFSYPSGPSTTHLVRVRWFATPDWFTTSESQADLDLWSSFKWSDMLLSHRKWPTLNSDAEDTNRPTKQMHITSPRLQKQLRANPFRQLPIILMTLLIIIFHKMETFPKCCHFTFLTVKERENEDVCWFQVNRMTLRAGMKPRLNSGVAQTSEPKRGGQPQRKWCGSLLLILDCFLWWTSRLKGIDCIFSPERTISPVSFLSRRFKQFSEVQCESKPHQMKMKSFGSTLSCRVRLGGRGGRSFLPKDRSVEEHTYLCRIGLQHFFF